MKLIWDKKTEYMKLGFVISMYDEIDITNQTVITLRQNECKIVVIQSDPGDEKKKLDKTLCDIYELLPDLAGSKQNYAKIVEGFKQGKSHPVAPRAVTRNFSRGFSIIKDFDIDYVIALEGDEKVTSITGITKIIEKMKKLEKHVGGTRTIGYTLHDEEGRLERYQDINSTDIMPQFFIADIESVRKGLFCDMKITNMHTSEQCLGDEILRFCKENNFNFFDVFYSICDYAYPSFIEGLHYNPKQISKIPSCLEGVVVGVRKRAGRRMNGLITKLFKLGLDIMKV